MGQEQDLKLHEEQALHVVHKEENVEPCPAESFLFNQASQGWYLGGVYASLFEYMVNVTVLKASVSFWNRITHTILIKTRDMGYSLLDISEIARLPNCGERYDEHIP